MVDGSMLASPSRSALRGHTPSKPQATSTCTYHASGQRRFELVIALSTAPGLLRCSESARRVSPSLLQALGLLPTCASDPRGFRGMGGLWAQGHAQRASDVEGSVVSDGRPCVMCDFGGMTSRGYSTFGL